MKKICILLAGVWCLSSVVLSAGPIELPADGPARLTSVEGLAETNTSAITTEVARATTAEGVNHSAITAEVDRATTAEGVNHSAITAEVDRATTAEGLLTPKTSVWGASGITPSVDLTTNTVAIQTKTIAGGDLTGNRVLHIWVSETDLGPASTNNIESLTLSTGTAIATVTAEADYWYCTAAAGTATAEIVGTAAGTNYLMVADGSTVNSAAIVFE